MDTYATINDMREIPWNTGYLLGNIYTGMGEIMGIGYHVDDIQRMETVELQLMTSHGSCTKPSHILITQDKMTSHP